MPAIRQLTNAAAGNICGKGARLSIAPTDPIVRCLSQISFVDHVKDWFRFDRGCRREDVFAGVALVPVARIVLAHALQVEEFVAMTPWAYARLSVRGFRHDCGL